MSSHRARRDALALDAQLLGIPDTEMGRLVRKVLLKRVGDKQILDYLSRPRCPQCGVPMRRKKGRSANPWEDCRSCFVNQAKTELVEGLDA